MKSAYWKILGIGFVSFALSLSAINSLEAAEKAPTHCHIHQEKLQRDSVEIEYGLISYEKEYLDAREKLFPFSNMTWGGGCVVFEDSPKFKEIDYCFKCRKAEVEWKKNRAKDKRQ